MNIPARFQSKAQEEITESYQRACDNADILDPVGIISFYDQSEIISRAS